MSLEAYRRIGYTDLPALESGVMYQEDAPHLLSRSPSELPPTWQELRGFEFLGGAAVITSVGEQVFSEREMQVASLVIAGLANAAIATYLGIGIPTVKTHGHRISTKIAEHNHSPGVNNNRAGFLRRMIEGKSPLMEIAAKTDDSRMGRLCERYIEVLDQVSQGKTNEDCGTSLYRSPATIKGYLSLISDELQATNRTILATYYVLSGDIELEKDIPATSIAAS